MIRVGIGGWNYEPWRGLFYPEDLPQAQELAHASRRVTSIEINSTFYRSQSPESFKKWAAAAPDDFLFSVKAPRGAVMRSELATAGESVERFLNSGLLELGDKLGPLFWQMPPAKKFDAKDIEKFFDLLPERHKKRPLRHSIEARHESFLDPKFRHLAQTRNIAIVHVDSEKHPDFGGPSADFAYARLQRTQAEETAGYPKTALKRWVDKARAWEKSGDVFVYFISGAKERAPAAAEAMLKLLNK